MSIRGHIVTLLAATAAWLAFFIAAWRSYFPWIVLPATAAMLRATEAQAR